MHTTFSDIKSYSKDLIEVHFNGLTEESWRRFFSWANDGRVKLLHNHWDAVEKSKHLDIEAYLDDRVSYFFNFDMDPGREYQILLISLTEASIDLAQEDLGSYDELNQVVADCIKLASIMLCQSFIMCPESNREHIVYEWAAR